MITPAPARRIEKKQNGGRSRRFSARCGLPGLAPPEDPAAEVAQQAREHLVTGPVRRRLTLVLLLAQPRLCRLLRGLGMRALGPAVPVLLAMLSLRGSAVVVAVRLFLSDSPMLGLMADTVRLSVVIETLSPTKAFVWAPMVDSAVAIATDTPTEPAPPDRSAVASASDVDVIVTSPLVAVISVLSPT